MPRFTTLTEAEKFLEQFLPARLPRPAYTTEHIVRFLASVDDPQNVPRAIHIAGTSGKTSTAYYAAALLSATGRRVGLLTSPHLEKLSERVQIDMRPLTDAEFCAHLDQFLDLVEARRIVLSHAELLYAFAFWEFARQKVDDIVVEVGMGGLHDATNVITRQDKVCVITDIGLDHTTTLGGTLAEIAVHKAGIIRVGNTVFCYPQPDGVMNVIRAEANKKHAELHVIQPPEPTQTARDNSQESLSSASFLPSFQRRNFGLALAAAHQANGRAFADEQIVKAAHTHIPGRMETLHLSGKTIIMDGAHNQQKLHSLAENLPHEPTAALVAFTNSRSRALAPMLAELAPFAEHLIITTLPKNNHHKSRDPEEIAAACTALGITSFTVEPDSDKALHALFRRPEKVLLITGSLYLLRYLRPELRKKIQQQSVRSITVHP